MSRGGKILIVVVLVAGIVAVLVVKRTQSRPGSAGGAPAGPNEPAGQRLAQEPAGALPRLVDLGAGQCIPCKMMAPILEELKKENIGRLVVEVLDVHENPDLITKYNVSVIPTQIFYSASGAELFRHEGFYPKEEITAKWKELGVELADSVAPARPTVQQ